MQATMKVQEGIGPGTDAILRSDGTDYLLLTPGGAARERTTRFGVADGVGRNAERGPAGDEPTGGGREGNTLKGRTP